MPCAHCIWQTPPAESNPFESAIGAWVVSTVKSDIEAALQRSAVADAKKVSVSISGSNVTLTGEVHSWNERETAAMSAWGTPGVRSVIDEMTLEY